MKHSNYHFPSNRYGMTQAERKYLGRKKKKETVPLWLVILTVDAVLWFFFTVVKPHIGIPGAVAEAAEVQDNSYYCQHLEDYTLDQQEAITNYCNSL